MKPFLSLLLRHKKIVITLLILLIGGGIIWMRSHAKQEPVRYVLGAASEGTVISSVSGSGQVSSEREISIKPESATGKVTNVYVKQGQSVKAGDAIVDIDPTDASKSVRDAERSVQDAQNSLKTAQLSLDKLKAPPDATDLLKAQNTLNAAQRALDDLKKGSDPLDIQKAQSDVDQQQRKTRTSDDGVTPEIVREAYDQTIVDARSLTQTLESSLQTVDSMLGIDQLPTNATYLQFLGVRSSGIIDQVKSQYSVAKTSVDALRAKTDALVAVKSTKDQIEQSVALVANAVSQTDKVLQIMQKVMDYSVTSASFSQSTLDNLRNSINTARNNVTAKISASADLQRSIDAAQVSYEDALAALQSAQISLEKLQKGSDANDIASAEDKVKEAQAALNDLKAGATTLDLATAQQSVNQKRTALASASDALTEARKTLAGYTVKAPIDGVIATIPVAVADDASPSVVVATLVTKVKISTLTLNEVDIVKVKQGQQATLTFDAIPDLTIAGSVAEVDLVGTASQGVVGYGVKIAFTTDSDQIKDGMSVSAVIQTAISADVVTVPNSAIQTIGNSSYVLVLPNATRAEMEANPSGVTSPTAPTRKQVTIGLADDTNTEIKDGLAVGDIIVVRTVQPTTQTTSASSANRSGGGTSNLLRVGGGVPGGFVGR